MAVASAHRTQPPHPQLAHPRGAAGHVVGWFLARANAGLNRWAVAHLTLPASGTALEIGFGPGAAVRLLARRLARGKVCGVDPSDVMVGQALRRNRAAVEEGRVELRKGRAEALPWPDGHFDAVLSLNNIQLWDPLDSGLREVRRTLRPGGELLVGLHLLAVRLSYPSGTNDAEHVGSSLQDALGNAGLVGVTRSIVQLPVGEALILRGYAPGRPPKGGSTPAEEGPSPHPPARATGGGT